MADNTGVVIIHGREYQTVAKRICDFRRDHPTWTIDTQIIERADNIVCIRATILDDNGRLLATGLAEENRQATQINRTSALENCETSAVGRALSFLGYVGSEIASADEVANAISQQNGNGSKAPRTTSKQQAAPPPDTAELQQQFVDRMNAATDLQELQKIGDDISTSPLSPAERKQLQAPYLATRERLNGKQPKPAEKPPTNAPKQKPQPAASQPAEQHPDPEKLAQYTERLRQCQTKADAAKVALDVAKENDPMLGLALSPLYRELQESWS